MTLYKFFFKREYRPPHTKWHWRVSEYGSQHLLTTLFKWLNMMCLCACRRWVRARWPWRVCWTWVRSRCVSCSRSLVPARRSVPDSMPPSPAWEKPTSSVRLCPKPFWKNIYHIYTTLASLAVHSCKHRRHFSPNLMSVNIKVPLQMSSAEILYHKTESSTAKWRAVNQVSWLASSLSSRWQRCLEKLFHV